MSLLWHEQNLHPAVSDRDFKRLLRFPPGRKWAEPLAENASWARTWFAEHARPWSAACRLPAPPMEEWAERFEPDTELIAVGVSAGPEAEAEAAIRWRDGEPDRYFFLECFAAAMVEALLADARKRLGVKRHLCPGYPGWPITDNQPLFGALTAAGAIAGPLEVLSSGMLSPKKSQLAVCAVPRVPEVVS